MYKLSPSDFAYLYEECKLCYWLKVKCTIYQPTKPMPAVFGAINSKVQASIVGHDLRALSPELPQGIVESQEGWVESIQFPKTEVYIKGKYDLLVRLPDDEFLIVDLKISQPDERKIEKYQTQLQAYKFAFENPKYGKPKKISRMGLLVMYPENAEFKEGKVIIKLPPKWLEIPKDAQGFAKFMTQIDKLLKGPTPKEDPNCLWCKYRHLGEDLSHKDAKDIPF